MCSKDAQCDHVTGECICPAGRFGDNCTKVCEPGTYGVNCNEECFCAHDAMCDPITGNCLCSAGLFGVHCTKKCPSGKYGINCSGICNCSNHEHCDVISGDCNSQTDTKVNGNSGNTVLVYIMMAAALTGLICVVALFVKAKEAIIRNIQKCQKNSSKPNIERRKAKRRLSSAPTQDAHTKSSIIDTETSLFHNPMEEELYCEIGDIDDLETDRKEMNKH
ncbi:uncharacterized protein LOC143074322 [Mytilus galloprovincialis]|uniref:uncharacterized protein LOC143074322 n=1 Tax=Mytilus galloprovincialis TaxID=29158 RepID=UPI003F7C2E6F